jgi:CPA1 family monovalent cation:H+ antiporter
VHDLELFIALLAGVVGLVWLAGPLRIPYPVLLVLGGLGAGLLPFVPKVEIEPGFVLLAFLPPILYRAAWTFAAEDVRMQWHAIALLAVGLVLVTIGAVAWVAHAVIGIPWAPAFILGAVLGPTDPVAATSVIRRLGAPEQMATILEGESLVNDGSGLTAFRIAVGVAGAETFHPGAAVLQFAGVALGGLALGAVLGYAGTLIRRRLQAAELEITTGLVTAYGAFALAERVGVSGILAVVAAGFVVGRAGAFTGPDTRIQAIGFWRTLSFVAESTLFLLVGLAFSSILGRGEIPLGKVAVESLAIAATILAVRLVWMYTVPYAAARLDRRIAGARPLTDRRERLLLGIAGMRGAVSVAAALAIPAGTAARDEVVLLTCGAVLLTLVPIALALPALMRALGLVREDEARRRYVDARVRVHEAAIDRAEEIGDEGEAPEELVARAREAYDLRISRLEASRPEGEQDGEDGEAGDRADRYKRVRKALLEAEREALSELSDAGEVRGETLRAIEKELDLEESRLDH